MLSKTTIEISNLSITGDRSLTCFNPSLVYYQNNLLLFYRFQSRHEFFTGIGFVKLNSKFRPISRHSVVQIPKVTDKIISFEDPRLFGWKNYLYMMHNQSCFTNTWSTSIVFSAVDLNGQVSQIQVPNYGKNLNQAVRDDAQPAFEKNWTPVIVEDEFYIIYEINPLTVLKFDPEQQTCIEVEVPDQSWSSAYQTYLSGSTCLIPWRGSEYIGLFHTYAKNGGKRLYSMGFYTVDVKQWRVTNISAKPILTAWKNKWKDTRQNALKKIFVKDDPSYLVVFPGGLIDCDDTWAVSYGWNDCCCYIDTYEKTRVIESLIPC
jgi:predicted GH43/DUF377 family glycosyl hydrolase